MTQPVFYSRSMFSQRFASSLQVKCIMSPRSVIFMGDLLVLQYISVLFALAMGDKCTYARIQDYLPFSASTRARLEMRSGASKISWLFYCWDVILVNRVKSTLWLLGSIQAWIAFIQPAGSSTHIFLLCPWVELLTYTHRFFTVSGLGQLGSVGCCGWVVGAIQVDILLFYTVWVVYYYVGLVCFIVLSYFSTVCDICLMVLCYNVLAADCFNCDILDTVVPGGWFGSLAVFFVFCIF